MTVTHHRLLPLPLVGFGFQLASEGIGVAKLTSVERRPQTVERK